MGLTQTMKFTYEIYSELIWHVISRSGVVISITNCYIRLTLLTFTYRYSYIAMHASYLIGSFCLSACLSVRLSVCTSLPSSVCVSGGTCLSTSHYSLAAEL